jgi:hypothetical protein
MVNIISAEQTAQVDHCYCIKRLFEVERIGTVDVTKQGRCFSG